IAAFDETVAALKRLGIRTIGTAKKGPAEQVAAGPLTIGFAAFTLWRNADAALFNERVSMQSDPTAWRRGAADKNIDLRCAIPQWDWEFRHFPHPQTQALARQLASHGVGLIAGHHAH